ncbi:MAG: ABC transporter ATP-binding protein [Gemmatimonadetes bacterium]|nr:ABC transporter ATP-binding protein [Gemmatimonadota bacterium]
MIDKKNAVVLSVEDLHAAYGELRVLKSVSFEVARGEILAIVGGSGSGKSTLLKHMLRLEEPLAGRVVFEGIELTALEEEGLEEARLGIGFLFQNGALLGSLTVEENVAMPLEMRTTLPRPVIDRLVDLRLSQLGLGKASTRLPSELSGGMRKRASLARALILDPPLLVCDEPGAGLDPVMARHLDQVLLRLRDDLGTTIVIVTHEVESIRRIADRLLFLEGGGVLFQGRVEEAERCEVESVRAFFSAE